MSKKQDFLGRILFTVLINAFISTSLHAATKAGCLFLDVEEDKPAEKKRFHLFHRCNDVLDVVESFLDDESLAELSLVCKQYHSVVEESSEFKERNLKRASRLMGRLNRNELTRKQIQFLLTHGEGIHNAFMQAIHSKTRARILGQIRQRKIDPHFTLEAAYEAAIFAQYLEWARLGLHISRSCLLSYNYSANEEGLRRTVWWFTLGIHVDQSVNTDLGAHMNPWNQAYRTLYDRLQSYSMSEELKHFNNAASQGSSMTYHGTMTEPHDAMFDGIRSAVVPNLKTLEIWSFRARAKSSYGLTRMHYLAWMAGTGAEELVDQVFEHFFSGTHPHRHFLLYRNRNEIQAALIAAFQQNMTSSNSKFAEPKTCSVGRLLSELQEILSAVEEEFQSTEAPTDEATAATAREPE